MTVFLGVPPAGEGEPYRGPARGCDCRNCGFYAGDDLNPQVREAGRWDGPWCDGTNSSCAYCGCARAENPLIQGGCATCSVRCSSRIDYAAWMADVGGTCSYDDIAFTQNALHLPPLIPQTDGSSAAPFDAVLRFDAWAMGLRRVFSPETWRLMPKFEAAGGAHAALGINDNQTAVLVGYGTDPVVEAFWSRRTRDRLIERIAEQGWDLVLAPNYSYYANYPMAELILNGRRNLLIAEEFAAAGVTCAPNLYWYRLRDLQRLRRWVEDTEIPLVAVNLQTFRTAQDWMDYALPGITWMSYEFPPTTQFVFTTGGQTTRLQQVLELFPGRCHIVTQKPWQTAAHGEVLDERGKWVPAYARPVDAFATSARRLRDWISGDTPWPTDQAPDTSEDPRDLEADSPDTEDELFDRTPDGPTETPSEDSGAAQT